MAKNHICLDIGSENLKMAEISAEGTAAQLRSFAVAPLDFFPDMTNEDRNAAIAQAAQSVLRDNRIKTKSVSISISGPAVFTRFVQLPRSQRARSPR